jgi:hypothetical protein
VIDVVLPTQYARSAGWLVAEPQRRLMAAVLQTVVDDCRGSAYRRARGYETPIGRKGVVKATAYVASTDRTWPFSFENLCDALGLNANALREALRRFPQVCDSGPDDVERVHRVAQIERLEVGEPCGFGHPSQYRRR